MKQLHKGAPSNLAMCNIPVLLLALCARTIESAQHQRLASRSTGSTFPNVAALVHICITSAAVEVSVQQSRTAKIEAATPSYNEQIGFGTYGACEVCRC